MDPFDPQAPAQRPSFVVQTPLQERAALLFEPSPLEFISDASSGTRCSSV
jgi:hypothetical protein